MPPSYLNMKRTKKHKNLGREGEQWMKDTANYCVIMATLITTVVFAAAFTVLGCSSQDTGAPIFWKSIWFRVFFISDIIALFSSSSSILIFLSILTPRFIEMDFLVSLPSKLLLGLTTWDVGCTDVAKPMPHTRPTWQHARDAAAQAMVPRPFFFSHDSHQCGLDSG